MGPGGRSGGVAPRLPTHRYLDPLDQVWLSTAERVGLRVVRSPEVYAHSAKGVLHIGTGDTLDPDDCLAQMIFHELCHAMVEGPASLQQVDWGLDNTSPKDLVHEHACLRLQAAWADRLGLRGFLAATTVFRRYYDALPEDPLADGEDPAIRRARAGYATGQSAPFAPHVQRALEATAGIVRLAAPFVGDRGDTQDALPTLYAALAAEPKGPAT